MDSQLSYHFRNLATRKALFAPVSIRHVFEDDPSDGSSPIHSATIRCNGTPLIQLTSGIAYAYDLEAQSLVEVCSPWFATYSPHWTRTRASNVHANSKSILTYLETTLNTLRPDIVSAAEAAAAQPRPKWFDDAIPLGHLETRLEACALLHSPTEYKTNLTAYARKIADEGYRNKAEQLAKDLYGPIS